MLEEAEQVPVVGDLLNFKRDDVREHGKKRAGQYTELVMESLEYVAAIVLSRYIAIWCEIQIQIRIVQYNGLGLEKQY